LILLLLGALACAPKPAPRAYDNSLFELASGFAAKEMCSCLFVSGRSEAACAAYTKVEPAVARYRIDLAERRVSARALGMGRQSARWVDAATGCVIEAPSPVPAGPVPAGPVPAGPVPAGPVQMSTTP
jgi:hypothetical protein